MHNTVITYCVTPEENDFIKTTGLFKKQLFLKVCPYIESDIYFIKDKNVKKKKRKNATFQFYSPT